MYINIYVCICIYIYIFTHTHMYSLAAIFRVAPIYTCAACDTTHSNM